MQALANFLDNHKNAQNTTSLLVYSINLPRFLYSEETQIEFHNFYPKSSKNKEERV